MPYLAEEADVRRVCELTDGLVLTGGKDIDPSLYGEDPLPGLGAWSPDGIVEGIESRNHRYVLGVQWHPENTAASDIFSRRLFDSFIEAVRKSCENI